MAYRMTPALACGASVIVPPPDPENESHRGVLGRGLFQESVSAGFFVAVDHDHAAEKNCKKIEYSGRDCFELRRDQTKRHTDDREKRGRDRGGDLGQCRIREELTKRETHREQNNDGQDRLKRERQDYETLSKTLHVKLL